MILIYYPTHAEGKVVSSSPCSVHVCAPDVDGVLRLFLLKIKLKLNELSSFDEYVETSEWFKNFFDYASRI